MMASEAVRQRLYLIQELEVSVLAIDAGLAELQASKPYHPRHFIFLLLLATGIECLLKIILHLHALETSGAFLSAKTMKDKYRHRIGKLLTMVNAECFTDDYRSRPVAGQDMAFIRNDPMLASIVDLIGRFATDDRYVYLDGISNPDKVTDTPQRRWEELEYSTMSPGDYVSLVVSGREIEAKAHANRELSACIERLVRALTRLLTLGALGPLGTQVSAAVTHYSMLRDDELGTHRRLSHS